MHGVASTFYGVWRVPRRSQASRLCAEAGKVSEISRNRSLDRFTTSCSGFREHRNVIQSSGLGSAATQTPVSNKFLQFNRNGNYAYRRSEQIRAGDGARLTGLASLRCVFVQDASQHLPRVKTADLASGTLFGNSVGTDDRYDFER